MGANIKKINGKIIYLSPVLIQKIFYTLHDRKTHGIKSLVLLKIKQFFASFSTNQNLPTDVCQSYGRIFSVQIALFDTMRIGK